MVANARGVAPFCPSQMWAVSPALAGWVAAGTVSVVDTNRSPRLLLAWYPARPSVVASGSARSQTPKFWPALLSFEGEAVTLPDEVPVEVSISALVVHG